MIKIEIKSWLSGEIIFEYSNENNDIKETVRQMLKEFIKEGKIIREAQLIGHDLSGVNFSGSSFDNSRFDNSSFYNSSFDNSRFDNSSFYNSRFYNSSFDNSSFDNSRFDNSSFDNSRFDEKTAENLQASGMLDAVKYDFFGRMLMQKKEVPALRKSLMDGNIDGSVYEGDCCCFMGTMAKAANCNYKEFPGLKPDAGSSTEKWFMGLSKGNTPENSAIAKITLAWIDEFLSFINVKP